MNRNLAYTLENWRTREIDIRKYPNGIFELTLQEIIKSLLSHHGRVLNFNELIFFLTFTLEGWKVYCTPLNRSGFASRYILDVLVEKYEIDYGALAKGGCPDFLLVNEKDHTFRFVEVKASEKSLNKKQVEWSKKFPYDLYIAKSAESFDGGDERNWHKRILKENKMKRRKAPTLYERYFKHSSGGVICAVFESEDMEGIPTFVSIMDKQGRKMSVHRRSWFKFLADASPVLKPLMWDNATDEFIEWKVG